MHTSTCTNTILLLLAMTLSGGCASLGSNAKSEPDPMLTYVVKRGDVLGNIAETFTGDIGNWREIAAINGIKDARMLRVGDTIQIPVAMLENAPDDDEGEVALSGSGTHDNAGTNQRSARRVAAGREVADASQGTAGKRLPAQAIAVERQASPGQTRTRVVPTARVELNSANANREFDLVPMENGEPAERHSRVRVVGSYTPRGLYEKPASWSRLVRRVAPGSTFAVERVSNGWFLVETDNGSAWLRPDDGELVE
ncbi:MAG: hypothetical protein CSB44_08000 [Gammaproteobacteria bacterium]|nr:MAG: hypothetical protein CSB44_08000 [Gammaproteobacteria bacterium]